VIDFSAVICTYNGVTKLPEVLEALRSQQYTEAIRWEIVIVDNNSDDETAELIERYRQTENGNVPLNYCFESRQGLAFARRTGVRAARGELLGFLDDDNRPAGDWVATAYHFGKEHPQAGAYGSRILGDYEVKPPENFAPIACFLGVIDRSPDPFRYDLLRRWLFPAGAGMVVRRCAWLESVPDLFLLTGVSGTSLAGKGEDIETLSYLRRRGWEIWHNPRMVISHRIPAYRLEKDYLLRLFRGVGLSRYPTRSLQCTTPLARVRLLLYPIVDLVKLALHYGRCHRVLNSDLVARCQLELLLYSLASPFFYWWRRRESRSSNSTVSASSWESSLKSG
jgi:glycosyltransferase involved in cell wall biosynthesis